MSLSPCASCRRLVREHRCPFCVRRGALGALGAAVIVLATACEPTTHDVVIDPPPTSAPSTTAAAPSVTASADPTPSAAPVASTPPTASTTHRDRPIPTVTGRPVQALYGGPPPPLEDEIV